MKENLGPFANPAFRQQMAANILAPMMDSYSGEFTENMYGKPLGVARMAGRISDVSLSVAASGKDDSNTLSVAGDVYINGTSCLTTQPAISHISGEVSQFKTTKVTGDTGITQRVLDYDNNSFSPGDIITYDLALTRTASPTTEIKHPSIIVGLEPI